MFFVCRVQARRSLSLDAGYIIMLMYALRIVYVCYKISYNFQI